VDASFVLGPRMLGLTLSEQGERHLVYHLANSAVLSVFFGRELGLDKAQLKQLAQLALLCEATFGLLDRKIQLVSIPERLPAEAQAQIMTARQQGALLALLEEPVGDSNLKRALCCLQLNATFDSSHTLYPSRILALCTSFERFTGPCSDHPGVAPHLAIAGMCKQLRVKFDPELLYRFATTVGTLAFKCLSGQEA
jgi:hypothetical protein